MELEIRGVDLPGVTCRADGVVRHDVHGGLQRRSEPDQLVRADADSARWRATVEVVDGGVDFKGPHVQGKRGERFVYVTWGSVDGLGMFTQLRRAKLPFRSVPPEVLARAVAGDLLVATVACTAPDGGPACATLKPPALTWSTEPA